VDSTAHLRTHSRVLGRCSRFKDGALGDGARLRTVRAILEVRSLSGEFGLQRSLASPVGIMESPPKALSWRCLLDKH
jgi:hypothetical protein